MHSPSDEHRRLKFGDVEIRKDLGEEREYATWSFERGAKTRSGANEYVPDRPFCPRMFATCTDRCPVKTPQGIY